jgi:hypothetical protein
MNKRFELNPKGTQFTHEMVKNPEGGLVYKDNSDINLFLQASAFKLRNSFYWTAEDRLQNLESAIDNERDFKYKIGLAYFLSNYLGIRLSPVIIATRLSTDFYVDKDLVHKLVKNIMDRPDKITNAIAYAQYSKGSGKELPPFFKRALKDSFERFDAYTLRKFRLRRRKVKTADVIKLLHPKPRNLELSKLYKAIIENSREASIEKGTVITEVLSDNKITAEDKQKWISKNLENVPINATVRNVKSIDSTAKNLETLSNKLKRGLRVENGFPVVKVLNPFDVLVAGLNSDSADKMKVIDKVLSEFVSNVDLGMGGKKISILVDVSGSMMSGGIDIAAKYFAFLFPMLKGADIKLYAFNTRVIDMNRVVEIYKYNANSIINIYNLVRKDFRISGGTALSDSIRKVNAQDNPDLLIVLSDEISWADSEDNFVKNIETPVIAINPYPSGSTVFNPTKPVIKMASIDAKIFYYIPILANFKKFKIWVKSLM